MSQLTNNSDIPDFLMKSTLGCVAASLFILTPFSVNNLIQGRYFIGVFTMGLTILSLVNLFICLRGKYPEKLNLFGMTPAIILAIAFTTHELGVIASYWAFMGVLAFYFLLPENKAKIANIVFIAIMFPVAWNVLETPVATRFFAVLLGVSFFAFLTMREITKQHYMLREQATTDPLTGLYNRSLLQNSLEHAIHQNSRTKSAMSIIMLDLDDFKTINDEHGHDVGDSVLQSLSEYLEKSFRGSDMLFRIGGEEFLALLYNTDGTSAHVIAEKLREGIERLLMIPDRTVTASIGVSGLQPDMGWKAWMKHCDDNLYHAKSSGRNQVVSSN